MASRLSTHPNTNTDTVPIYWSGNSIRTTAAQLRGVHFLVRKSSLHFLNAVIIDRCLLFWLYHAHTLWCSGVLISNRFHFQMTQPRQTSAAFHVNEDRVSPADVPILLSSNISGQHRKSMRGLLGEPEEATPPWQLQMYTQLMKLVLGSLIKLLVHQNHEKPWKLCFPCPWTHQVLFVVPLYNPVCFWYLNHALLSNVEPIHLYSSSLALFATHICFSSSVNLSSSPLSSVWCDC